MSLTNDQIIEAFKQVVDPELFIDIWTLGLIYHFEHEEKAMKVKMTFTSMACPAGPQLVEEVRQKLLTLDGVENVEVEVVFQPPWEPSEELKGLMGIL